MRTHSSVSRWLSYDPNLGHLTWIKGPHKGGRAGHAWGQRHCITMGGDRFNAADIAWLLHTGEWPATSVAQYDGDPSNTAIDNLYLSAPQAPARPTAAKPVRMPKAKRQSPTGVPGVAPYRDKFKATVSFAGRQTYLGIFDTVADAKAAIDKWHADRKRAERDLQRLASKAFARP